MRGSSVGGGGRGRLGHGWRTQKTEVSVSLQSRLTLEKVKSVEHSSLDKPTIGT